MVTALECLVSWLRTADLSAGGGGAALHEEFCGLSTALRERQGRWTKPAAEAMDMAR